MSKQSNALGRTHSIAVVSPGLLPVPPILGGSVETVIHNMALTTKEKFNIDIYSAANRKLPSLDTSQNPAHYRYSLKNKLYFNSVRENISKKNYSIIQVENRPLFISKTKPLVPDTKFICSLHSLIHIEEKLIKRNLTSKIFTQCETVLVYSEFMRNRLAKMFPKISEKFQFIHLGTDPSLFKPRWLPAEQDKLNAIKKDHNIPPHYKVILFAGRVIPIKGVHILLEAMSKVVHEYPDCCLVVVGSSWFSNRTISPYIQELHNHSAGIMNNIRFTNYVSYQKIPSYFALADVFVCPSQWDEPFGLVNVEAMASGVPVVASARGGIPEIVRNGHNGFLIKNETDPSSFAKCILTLLKNPDIANSFGVNGRNTVEKYFNWNRAGEQLVNLYENLLN